MGLELLPDCVLASRIEGQVADRVGETREKPNSAPAGPTGASGGVHEGKLHLASEKTDLEKVEGLGHWSTEMATKLFLVQWRLSGCFVLLQAEAEKYRKAAAGFVVPEGGNRMQGRPFQVGERDGGSSAVEEAGWGSREERTGRGRWWLVEEVQDAGKVS